MDDRKKAIVILDRGTLRIVYGNSVKSMAVAEVSHPGNAAFLDRVFEDFRVLAIQSVADMTREQLEGLAGAGSPKQAEQPELPRSRTVRMPPAHERAEGKPPRATPGEDDDGSFFVKSNFETLITVDDLFLDEFIPGTDIRRSLAISPSRPVNLAIYDQKAVQRSAILKRMLQTGKLERISGEEAAGMLAAADREDAAKFNEESQRKDREIDRYCGVVPAGMSAEEYAERVSSGSAGHGSSRIIDGPAKGGGKGGAQEIDEAASVEVTGGGEGEQSMEGLLKEIAEEQQGFAFPVAPEETEPAEEPASVRKARLAARPAPQKSSPPGGGPIKRK